VIAYTALELMCYLHTQDVEREWKMRALAAQLPRRSGPSVRDLLVRGLRALARLLDPTVVILSAAKDPS
jgi:hypothetical protein